MLLFDELSWRRSAIFKLSFCARVRNESSASGLLALPRDSDASGSPPHVHDLAAAPFFLRTSQQTCLKALNFALATSCARCDFSTARTLAL